MPLKSRPSHPLNLLVALTACLIATGLRAEMPISVSLTGAAEVPSVITGASGMMKIEVKPNRMLRGRVNAMGMTPTMAHIHDGAIGKNGPPIITLIKRSDNAFVVPADTKLSEIQYASYLAGNLYVNVHSLAYPNGEIRGQLPGKPMRIAY